ncbi:unnamed protein product [Microthlaspi erraticum]|uniref:F-box domain-containing protein n=1 Tax=Microthlaspi erraticum TaxID=1685480 RepID=A0A6D2IM96_9BRAS|nr:unnamed protein product [Microthlaspi erraticum]
MADDRKIDSISSLPDVILQHILSSIPTKLAVTTSLLSKRWRHVWCDTPCLSLDIDRRATAVSIKETLTRYTAPNVSNFHLKTTMGRSVTHMEMWIKFAISHNVENLSLDLCTPYDRYNNEKYAYPDFSFINSSVCWTSLKKLSLCDCCLSDESLAKILSGCPLLQSLTLSCCDELMVVDLSKSLHLTTLKINRDVCFTGPKQIVAPHIHRLKMLFNYKSPCLLVDVSFLVEANLGICYSPMPYTEHADFFQEMVLKMLEKLQNAEKLTFGENILQILSLAQIRGVPSPMLKVKDLTLETNIDQYVIPGVERVLQNSPHLKKLTVHTMHNSTIQGSLLDKYLMKKGLSSDMCWRSKDGVIWNKNASDIVSKHVTSFLELMLKNTKALEKIVVQLDNDYLKFQEVVTGLAHNNNVPILLSPSVKTIDEWFNTGY